MLLFCDTCVTTFVIFGNERTVVDHSVSTQQTAINVIMRNFA